jgi:hypothetical protein
MRKDTDQIIAELESGVRPWHQPWNATHMDGRVVLPLRHNGVAYRGVNVLALWMQAMAKGYAAPIWMTFKQGLDLGGCVRKGEKGSLERGFLRTEDWKGKTSAGKNAEGEGKAERRKAASEKLVAELTAYRTAGLRNALAQSAATALVAVVHGLAAATFFRGCLPDRPGC